MATPYVLIPDRVKATALARREQGSASVEFVLLFPALFLILYAIITYGLVFGAQQALTLAAAEGGRAALRYQQVAAPGATPAQLRASALALREQAAQAAAQRPLGWLTSVSNDEDNPQAVASHAPCPPPNGQAAGGVELTCLTVRVTYNYDAAPLVPSLLGPLMSLPVPPALSSVSVVQLSDMQLF